ncbi:hypothetical protein TRICI_001789 [Trichomonascus ciferrii]|uniref:PRISE-like Rossmann-fold domain-containing protein n=1 Tax=Trichomonascus ciferrii TaxID=44093 RepID=A0A642V9V4_9ASCO|nr:hypothetical protein TRICI_001789 [Trichomonascus ciferrii]
MSGKHALVFGASGISGWSILNQALTYPTPTTFNRITGICNRPLTKQEVQLPDDPRINIVPGIDLTGSVDNVVKALKEKVESVETVNTVYFCAYIQTSDFESLKKVNTDLLRVAIEAVEQVAPKLEAVILQTGGKGYGFEFPDKVEIKPPIPEDTPRIPEPYKSKIFYYTQYDLLTEMSKGKKWSFSEVRPDGIVGFVPGKNAMNMAQGMAIYLTLYRELHGAGAEIPFPGRTHGYHATHCDTFQDILAKMEIYVSLNRDKCPNGSAFNCADGGTVTWAQVWPGICAHFGLKGVEPTGRSADLEAFVKQHKDLWDTLTKKHGLKSGTVEAQGWGHTQYMLVDFDFNREFSLKKARSAGFTESIPTVEGYKIAFDRMAAANIIPKPSS